MASRSLDTDPTLSGADHGVAFGCIWGALAIYTLETTWALRWPG